MKFLDPYRWLIGGALVAALVAGFFFWRDSLKEDGRAEVRAEVSKQALKQIERAQDQEREWKDQANETDARNQELEDALIRLRTGNTAAAGRLRDSAPSAKQMAGATPEACAANAAEAEHDLGECAGRLAEMGDTAAAASKAAWEFHDKWPAYQEFQGRLTSFKSQLKGQP